MYDVPSQLLRTLPQNCRVWPTSSTGRLEIIAVSFDNFQVNIGINTFGDVSIHSMPDYFPLTITETDSIDSVLERAINGIPLYRTYNAEVEYVRKFSGQKRNWVSDAIYKHNAAEREPLEVIDGNAKHMIAKAEDIEPWHVSMLRKLGFIKTYYIARFVHTSKGFILDGLTGYPTKEERDDVLTLLHNINVFRLTHKKNITPKEKLAVA